MRLIDGDALADMLSNARRKLDPKIYKTATEFYLRDEMLLNLEQIVRGAPTIEPVKHGKVIEEAGFDFCSECDHRIEDLVMNYCPNCGACLDADDPEGSTAK